MDGEGDGHTVWGWEMVSDSGNCNYRGSCSSSCGGGGNGCGRDGWWTVGMEIEIEIEIEIKIEIEWGAGWRAREWAGGRRSLEYFYSTIRIRWLRDL